MDLLDVLGRYPRTNRLHTLSIPRQQQPHDVERCPPSSSLVAERVKKGTQPMLEMLLPSGSRFHASQWSKSHAEWKEKSGEVVLGRGPVEWLIAIGLAMIAVILAIAIAIPNPTDFQVFVFRVVLALGAGAMAALIPGFFEFRVKATAWVLRAGGGLG